MPRIFELRTFLQSQNGWKYGISLDENVKTHPLIRPFKTLTEKVRTTEWPCWFPFPGNYIPAEELRAHSRSSSLETSGLEKLLRSWPMTHGPRTSFKEHVGERNTGQHSEAGPKYILWFTWQLK